MTREEAIHILDNLKPPNTESSFDGYVVGKAITMAIEALEQVTSYETTIVKLTHAISEQEPKWDRLYSWLNDMRLGIAPDETVTDIDERNVRTAQVDLLDEIMEWMVEPQERSDK